MLKSNTVGSAMQRSIWHYQQVLVLSWKLYQSCAQGIWQGLHRVYQFALSLKLEKQGMSPIPASGAPRVSTICTSKRL